MSTIDQAGFRILPMPEKISAAFIDAYREVVTPHIGDSMNRLTGSVGLQRYHRAKKLVGRAVTVKARPGDNLMIHKALDMAEPGDVIMVDANRDISQALVGELMMMHAQVRGVAGFVIDGAIRDVAAFYNADFPCYARGNTLRGPFKDGPGEINVPVSVGGMPVEAGDLVVGDEDGVIAIPQRLLQSVLDGAHRQAVRENERKRLIAAGQDKRDWIDAYLRSKGVIL